ncbi:MAG: pyruvate dehydrogenase (acetyl-transferring), homodimeric type, partial [Actinobacteria bacterium]|nr:pyruvate dehydrogenase (acetyl-transferring), homodimeric type [Actinomycetota bacterium]
EQLVNFRREFNPGGGLSSYPHPWLMPNFWEFPTVSMGLGPLTALYHARFNRYLQNRQLDDTSQSRVWAFLGDGECDEPETLGALSLASRERLDNLVFVVNCNLQRLDGPVRGNGKVIQELEAVFRGNGWNVIKVILGSKWDELLAKDKDGVLLNKLNTTVDGEFQRYSIENGAYIRDNFFGPDPRLRALVSHLSDDDLVNLPRGGHDYRKLYAAYKAATENLGTGAPTVILCKTIKGWTLGPQIEGRNATHQIKKMTKDQMLSLRDRLYMQDEIPEDSFDGDLPPYFRPAEDSIEYQYMMERRRQLGGSIPKRIGQARRPMTLPSHDSFAELTKGSGGQAVSTTMGFTRLLRNLARDEKFGKHVVPIIPDEARTFGMDSLFRELKIYAAQGQKYQPVDHDLLLSYTEATDGQILEEGITEAGSTASFIAAGSAYATRGLPMVPFYTFYSMFGFQRVGDLIWQAADMRTRGFLLGATAGRTTLMGEGLQHQDGHSLVLASTVPAVQAYDPAFAYEVAVIVREGMQRMYGQADPGSGLDPDVFYYLTLYNENLVMPALPDDPAVVEGIMRGLYRFQAAPAAGKQATLLFSGSAYVAASAAATALHDRYDVGVELWSATSYKALREEALAAERWNRLHPTQPARTPLDSQILGETAGPIVAVSDFMKIVPEQVARWLPDRTFTPLGTDGMGRSDTREALRRFFEIDEGHVVVAVLASLAARGEIDHDLVNKAIGEYDIDPDAVDPYLV